MITTNAKEYVNSHIIQTIKLLDKMKNDINIDCIECYNYRYKLIQQHLQQVAERLGIENSVC